MTTWQRGRRIVTARRVDREGSLPEFVDELRDRELTRVPGHRGVPAPRQGDRRRWRCGPTWSSTTCCTSTSSSSRSHVGERAARRRRTSGITVDDLGYTDDGIVHLSVRFGFQDEPGHPGGAARRPPALARRAGHRPGRRVLLPVPASRSSAADGPGMRAWRKGLFIGAGPQRRQPGRLLPPARRPDRGDGVEDRAVTRRGHTQETFRAARPASETTAPVARPVPKTTPRVGRPVDAAAVLAGQRLAGNAAVQRWLDGDAVVARQVPPVYTASEPGQLPRRRRPRLRPSHHWPARHRSRRRSTDSRRRPRTP